MMKRRVFIRTGIAATIAVLGALYFLDFKRTTRRIIIEDTSKLKISEGAVERFFREADLERFWDEFSFLKKMFVCVQHVFHSFHIRMPYFEKYLQYRNKITGQFLFSTDLFYRPIVPGRTVKYLGFHNPYKTACSNPFTSSSDMADSVFVTSH